MEEILREFCCPKNKNLLPCRLKNFILSHVLAEKRKASQGLKHDRRRAKRCKKQRQLHSSFGTKLVTNPGSCVSFDKRVTSSGNFVTNFCRRSWAKSSGSCRPSRTRSKSQILSAMPKPALRASGQPAVQPAGQPAGQPAPQAAQASSKHWAKIGNKSLYKKSLSTMLTRYHESMIC